MSQIFVKGSISSDIIQKMILNVQSHKHSGALNMFLGQIRADEIKSAKSTDGATKTKIFKSSDIKPNCTFGVTRKLKKEKSHNNQIVTAIDYSCYEDMAIKVFEKIRLEGIKKFNLNSVDIYHSLGKVPVGGISLAVFVSSGHRKPSFEGLEWIVEQIKQEVPIFGKEIFEEGDFQWKVND